MKKFISPLVGLLLLAGAIPAYATGTSDIIFSVASTSGANTAHDKASVSVKGTKATGLISYTVTATSAAQTVKVTVTPPSSATNWEVPVTGLIGGASYSFIVTTTDQTGSTDSTAQTFTPISVPAQPTSVSVVAKNTSGITSAEVTFTQADEGGSPITKYILTSSLGASQDCASPANVSGSKVCTFTNTLPADKKVKFTVVAVNSIGSSVGGSSTVDVRVPTTPGDATLVNAERQTDGSVKVTWVSPVDDGGTPITGYAVALTPANGTELTASVGAVNEATFTNVANGNWTAKVTAKNLAGSGNQVVDATPLSIQSTDQAMTLTPTPTISGTAQVGQSLTAVAGTWDAGVALAYQWNQDDAPIVGATSTSYTLTTSNLGGVISVTVTATKTGFIDASRTSSNTAAVIAAQSQNQNQQQNQNQSQSQNNTPAPAVVPPAPTPTATPTPKPTPTPEVTATPTPTATPIAKPEVSTSPSPSPSPSSSPTLKSVLPTKAIPANTSVSAVSPSVKPARVVQVTPADSSKTTSIKKNSTIALTLPTVPKGTIVKQVLVGPDGKAYTLVSGTTSKSGQVSSPTLKFAKAGTYTLNVTIGTKKKIVRIVVK